MKSGYKQTEIGEIPEDWEVVALHSVAQNITTKYGAKTGRCVDMEHIDQETGRLLGFGKIEEKASVKNHFLKGDILFGKLRPYLRKYWKASFEGGCTTEILVIRSTKKSCSDFLFYVVQQDEFIDNSIANSFGTKMPRTSWKLVGDFMLPLPPLPEQQKIAEILSTVDEKMAVIDEQLAQTQELKKGLMQRLLTKGIGHTAFKDSPLGEIPDSWEVKRIVEVASYVDYRGKTPPKVNSGVFLVTARNIKNGKIDYSLSKEYVPSELYEEVMGRGKPRVGDVLITTEAPLGEVAAIDREDVALAQRIIKYRADRFQLDNTYFKYFLLSPIFQMALDKEATGSTVKGIKGSRLHKMQLIVPSSLEEQRQIAEILSTIDEKLQVLIDKKAQYQELKRGLMQQLLTGQRRVKVSQEDAALV